MYRYQTVIRRHKISAGSARATGQEGWPATPTESSSRWPLIWATWVTDWSFSFRCPPSRITPTQLRLDTARLFAAQERTCTALFSRPLSRTGAILIARRSQKRPPQPRRGGMFGGRRATESVPFRSGAARSVGGQEIPSVDEFGSAHDLVPARPGASVLGPNACPASRN